MSVAWQCKIKYMPGAEFIALMMYLGPGNLVLISVTTDIWEVACHGCDLTLKHLESPMVVAFKLTSVCLSLYNLFRWSLLFFFVCVPAFLHL